MSKNLDLSAPSSGGGQPTGAGAFFGGGAPAGASGGGAASGAGAGSQGIAGQAAYAAIGDSAIQAQIRNAAYEQAQQGWNVARDGLGDAVTQLGSYVQEGPAGVSILCFLGGIATTIVGILGVLNFTRVAASPFQYVLNLYLTLFGIVTFLLEADVEAVRKLKIFGALAPWVEQYQLEIFKRANFLTELRGRGFFFVFVGSLAITQCFPCLLFIVGIWNLVMGVLCVLMSYGINPTLASSRGPQSGEMAADPNQAPFNQNF